MKHQTLSGVRAMRRSIPPLLLCLAFSAPLLADDYRYTRIQVPGALETVAHGINARGEIVGSYTDADGIGHAFLLRDGDFITIDIAGAAETLSARSINARGDIVGNYVDAEGVTHVFLLSDGVTIPIDYPNASSTLAGGVNNAGDITGTFFNQAGGDRGFIFKDGAFHKVHVPGSIGTQVYAAQDNGRVLAGQVQTDSGFHGFIRRAQRDFELFDFPGGFGCTGARSINQRGDIVGGFAFSADECHAGTLHGFLLKDGEFTQIDVPKSIVTQAFAINDDGVIVGRFVKSNGKTFGFRAVPKE